MKLSHRMAALSATAILAACSGGDDRPNTSTTTSAGLPELSITAADLEGNPFLEDWDTPFGVPPFDEIKDEHFMPAFTQGILDMRAEIDAIASNAEPPTFENTILAMELAGDTAKRVRNTFNPLVGTELNDALRKLQKEMGPMWSREMDAITFNDALFMRVQALYEQRDELELDEQEARLLELTHRRFVRFGAALPDDAKARVADINSRISELTTQFGQNLLAATKAFTVELSDESDTAGLSDDFKSSIWNDEKQAWVLGLNRSVYETFMTQSENRELRKRMFDGYVNRANSGEFDNGPLLDRDCATSRRTRGVAGVSSHTRITRLTFIWRGRRRRPRSSCCASGSPVWRRPGRNATICRR